METAMGNVKEIERQILELSGEEFAELRAWFAEEDAKAWDAQFEADVRAGKLDALGAAAKRAHAAGKTAKL
jgi:hypothetical protein